MATAQTHHGAQAAHQVECGSGVTERARMRVIHLMRAMEEWNALFLWEASADPTARPPASQYPLALVLASGDSGDDDKQVPGAMGEAAIAAFRHYVTRVLPELELMPRYPGGEPIESPDRVLLTAYIERPASPGIGAVTVLLAYGPGTAWDAVKRTRRDTIPAWSPTRHRTPSPPPARGRSPLRKRSPKARHRTNSVYDVIDGDDGDDYSIVDRDDARMEHPLRRSHAGDIRRRGLVRLRNERMAAWHAKRNRVLMTHEFEDDDDIENNISDAGHGGSYGRTPGSGYGSTSDTELDDSDDIDEFHVVTPEA